MYQGHSLYENLMQFVTPMMLTCDSFPFDKAKNDSLKGKVDNATFNTADTVYND